MELIAFWLNESFFYLALASSCAAAILALAQTEKNVLFKITSGLPPISLLILGTAPFAARSSWHGEFADQLDALLREVTHQAKSVAVASEELTRLTSAMRARYPQARWGGKSASHANKEG